MRNNYEDIINLKHYVSKKHPQMSMEARAAQFAPFAALNGYGEAVDETARLTEKRIEIDDGIKQIINEKLQEIKQNIKNKPEITVTYFIPDEKKQGGKYVTAKGCVKNIDEYRGYIILENQTEVQMCEISKLEF